MGSTSSEVTSQPSFSKALPIEPAGTAPTGVAALATVRSSLSMTGFKASHKRATNPPQEQARPQLQSNASLQSGRLCFLEKENHGPRSSTPSSFGKDEQTSERVSLALELTPEMERVDCLEKQASTQVAAVTHGKCVATRRQRTQCTKSRKSWQQLVHKSPSAYTRTIMPARIIARRGAGKCTGEQSPRCESEEHGTADGADF